MPRLSRAALGSLVGALLVLGGCGMLTGVDDLRTEAAADAATDRRSPPPTPDAATSGTDTGPTDGPPLPTGRLREITFESGSVTGTNGGDTAVGSPLVTTDGALRGKYSMVVGGPKAFITTSFPGQAEIYASFAFAVAMFPPAPEVATPIARVGFAGGPTTLELSVRARGIVVSIGGATINSDAPIEIGIPYRIGVHIVESQGSVLIESWVAPTATGAFDNAGPRITTNSPGLVNRIELGSLGADSLTALFDHLLVDSLAMPTP